MSRRVLAACASHRTSSTTKPMPTVLSQRWPGGCEVEACRMGQRRSSRRAHHKPLRIKDGGQAEFVIGHAFAGPAGLAHPRRIRQNRCGDGVMDATLVLIDSDAELGR